MNTFRRLVVSTILVVLQLSGFAAAQEKRSSAEPRGLALEVTFLKGTAPAFQGVPLVNNSSSLEVVSLEPLNYSLPWYQLTMRNLSAKTVALIAIDVFAGNRLRLSSRPQGQRGEPLIEPGALFSCKVKGVEEVLMNRYHYEPNSPPAQSIVIKSVVFSDGSYEGDVEAATHFKAQTLGCRIQLTRIAALLQETMDVAESGATDAIALLAQKVSALSFDVQPSMIDDRSKSLANLDQRQRSNFRTSVQYSLHRARRQLLDEIEEFQKSHKKPGDEREFREWLAATNEKYNRWLSSCERVSTL